MADDTAFVFTPSISPPQVRSGNMSSENGKYHFYI